MPEAVRARASIAVLLLTLGSAAAVGCAASTDAPKSGPPPNVLLVTMEAFRPDHISGSGYTRRTTPNLDALARRGVTFRQAVTVAGRTVQSFPSILTGVLPPVHGLRYEGQSSEILAGRMTLTRALKDRGYDAFAVTQGLNVGLHRDFDVYDPDIYLDEQGRKVMVPTRNDHEATLKAVQWLRGRRGKPGPFFLWLRYVAPHWPYEAPAPYTEMFDPGYTGAHSFNEEVRPGVEHGDLIFGLRRLPPREIEHAIAHYDGELAYTDAAIGELLKGVDDLGATARTIVLVTADHGESLGEHDYFFEHGAYLYEPTVRVPLIIVAPGRLPAGGHVESLASTIDIVPTLLELAGVTRPEGLQGHSLVSWALGKTTEPGPPAYCESGRNFYPENPRQYVEGIAGKWRMMRDDRFKLIQIPRAPQPIREFYDLRADPGETTNVLDRFPQEAARLQSALDAIIEADPGREDRADPPLPEGLEEQLRSLGYVGGGTRP
jgi:arylsulfatase A-like enzyme